MITVILILTIFNTGLILIMGGGIIYAIRNDMVSIANKTGKHIEDYTKYAVESAVDALYNMDSLKQKTTMCGKVEV